MSLAISKAASLISPIGLDPAENPMNLFSVSVLAAISPIIDLAELPVQMNINLVLITK